ncbi:MAG: preprotein translocase subunit YajC [bacterium]|jgi:preprotein translocase subunit YajC
MYEQYGGLITMALMFGIFYFLVIRPQQKQRKQRMEMLDNLKKGDKVVSIGGIFGTIVEIKEDTIKLKVSDNLELKMTREAVGYKLK